MSLFSGASGIPWSWRWVDFTFPGSFITRLPSAEPHTRPGDTSRTGPGAAAWGPWSGRGRRLGRRLAEVQLQSGGDTGHSSPTEALTLELKAGQGYRRATWGRPAGGLWPASLRGLLASPPTPGSRLCGTSELPR